MAILVIAQSDGGNLNHVTKSVVHAATQIGGGIDLLVFAGDDIAQQAVKLDGVARVLQVNSEIYAHNLAENLAIFIKELAPAYGHILAPATTFGKDFMPRLAAILDVSQTSDITAVLSSDTFIRPIYAGNVLATVQSSDVIKIITVRPSAFDKVGENGNAEIIQLDAKADSGLSQFVSEELSQSTRPALSAANIVVSGGRGVGSAESFKLIEDLADKLGGAVGASRAAVDAGYVSNDLQVGQTGQIVAPDLYIAMGISGAIQHLAGMKNSKVIVAINKDENAPIFEIADYGLVADLFDTVPEMIEKL